MSVPRKIGIKHRKNTTKLTFPRRMTLRQSEKSAKSELYRGRIDYEEENEIKGNNRCMYVLTLL